MMLSSFSQRQKILIPTELKPDGMPIELRNRLWNTIKSFIRATSDTNALIRYIWDSFLKQDVDTLHRWDNYSSSGYSLDQIKDYFYKSEWYSVYDFIEFIILCAKSYEKNEFIDTINYLFLDEHAPYKIIDGLVTPLTTTEEVVEIEEAIHHSSRPVSEHIKKAIELYRKRPQADYQNSIKESISAIEALSREILQRPKATLGVLADQLDVHPAFKKAIKELYGWTSDEGGIRHAGNGLEMNVDVSEARYMLVQCSALVNYIRSKHAK